MSGPLTPTPAAAVRLGVMQVLVSALAFRPGEIDDRTAIELTRMCLKTTAWCVREEMARNLRKALEIAPLTADVIDNLITVAVAERNDHAGRLAEYARFLATAGDHYHESLVKH